MDEQQQVSTRLNLQRFWRLLKPYRGKFYVLLAAVLAIESIVVAERYLFKVIVDQGTAFSAGDITHAAFGRTLALVAFAFVAMVLLRGCCKWAHIHLINIIDAGLIADFKRKFFNHIIGLHHGFHTTHKSGSLISRITRGGRAVESMTDTFVFNAAPIVFQLSIASAALLALSWISVMFIIFTVMLFVGYSVVVQRLQMPAKVAVNEKDDVEKAAIGDFILNIESIKYFGKESAVGRQYHDISDDTKKAMLRHWNYYRWLDSGHAVILGIGTFLIIAMPVQQYLDGAITLGTLVFIYTVYLSLVGPMFSLVHGIRGFYQAVADFDSLYKYDAITNEIRDKHEAQPLTIRHGVAEFDDVTFKYHGRELFQGFRLRIGRHQRIALVGHSGSGKTTLVKLLYRLYDVQGGAIRVDGRDIRDVTQESLRAELSIVPQECVLFDDTIYNNIAFSRPDASREEVLSAIHSAQLDKVVAAFPNGVDTIVGERGVKLSGGEKQRVSIARALLADRKMLVLDEATSSLDSQTEAEIQEALKVLMRRRTTIIIAHRLSTIMHADKIVVLDKGRIVQQGTHKELIRRRGVYRRLWNLQKGGYIA